VGWISFSADHAIERVALTFQFAEPITNVPWKRIVSAADSVFPRETHGRSVQQMHSFQIGMPVVLPSPAHRVEDTAGFVYRKLDDGTPIEDITIRRDCISFGVSKYQRWESFAKRARDTTEHFVSDMISLTDMSLIQLEYWDRFTHDSQEQISYKSLFSSKSGCIPPLLLDSAGHWHSHVGFFMPEPDNSILINLNIDVVDVADPEQSQESRRSVGIYSMARDAKPDISSTNAIYASCDHIHNIVKTQFAMLLDDSVLDSLGLSLPKGRE